MVSYFQFPSTHVTKVIHDFSTKSAITSSSIAQLCWLLLLWWQLYQNRCNFLNLNGTDATSWNCWFSICCQQPPFPMKFMPFFFYPQSKNHLSLAQMSWFLSNNAKTGVLLLSWIQDDCQSPGSPLFFSFLSVNGWLSEIEDECRSSCSSSGVTAPQATPGSLTTSYLVVSTRLLFHLLLIITSYFFCSL